MRGFLLSGSYVSVIGFEITHTVINSGNTGVGVYVSGNGCLVQDNYIHNTGAHSIRVFSNRNIIRGNKCTYPRGVPGDQLGETAIHIVGDNNLVEYNHLEAVGDYLNVFGSLNIVRNQYLGPCGDTDFPDYPTGDAGHHIDMLQWGYHPSGRPLIRGFLENNFGISNLVHHSHGFLVQGGPDSSRYFIARGNVVARIGSGGYGANPFIDAYLYHNSFIENKLITPGDATLTVSESNGYYCENVHIWNNLLHTANRPTGQGYEYVEPADARGRYTDHNLFYRSGTPRPLEANGIVGEDPLLINPAGADYHLSAGSPARNRAGAITLANGSGNGTSIVVDNANRFTDGFGMTEGDWIAVANSSPVRIIGINYDTHTLTLSSSISWADNDPVYWATPYAAIRDIGALPYLANGYQYGITIASPGEGAAVGGPVQIQASVTNPENVRFVIFHVNGVPVGIDHSTPFTYSWTPSRDGAFALEARAYSRFADTTLSKNAIVNVLVGVTGTPPPPPENLRVVP